MISTTIHDQLYEFYSWDFLGKDMFELAKKIIDSNQKFDRIVALAKGGLTFSRSLVDFLKVDNVSSIQIESYTGINQTESIPVITQSLPVAIKGESILIFDDLVDYGTTMQLASEYLHHHGAKTISTACLIAKPWSKFKVDFSVRPSEAWVIFPNEIRESIELLVEKWSKMGDSSDQIKQQLLEIGFSEAEVALFATFK